MKAVILMFDTLRRDFLPNYNNLITNLPNFKRLDSYCVKFDNFYVGSLPCMPARRDLHTGRLNFLHRSWSPLEPFDDSIFEILKENNIYTHLITDHQHYWEDGGATYHNRYNSYEFVRGQEGDLWKANLNLCNHLTLEKYIQAEKNRKNLIFHDEMNKSYIQNEEDFPQVKCINLALEFLDKNYNTDNWLLQVENFDPHEPFYVPERFKNMVDSNLKNKEFDWPEYSSTLNISSEEKLKTWKENYIALMYMCDEYLGKILDKFDEYNLWEDTMLIVNTDHGFMFGEKEWSGKAVMPVYNEIAHIPFFIWDPTLKIKNETRKQLAQTPDISPTILEFFNIPVQKDMTGKALQNILKNNSIHSEIIYGYFGSHVCITDGNYTYMRASTKSNNEPLYEYTLMPTRMRRRFTYEDFKEVSLSTPLPFTKNMKVLKIKSNTEFYSSYSHGNLLFDLKKDPKQEKNIFNPKLEKEMLIKLRNSLKYHQAPIDEYTRLGIPINAELNEEFILKERKTREKELQEILGRFNDKKMPENIRKLLIILGTLTGSEYMNHLYIETEKIDKLRKFDIKDSFMKLNKFQELSYIFDLKIR